MNGSLPPDDSPAESQEPIEALGDRGLLAEILREVRAAPRKSDVSDLRDDVKRLDLRMGRVEKCVTVAAANVESAKDDAKEAKAKAERNRTCLDRMKGRDGAVKWILGILGAAIVATWAWVLAKFGVK